MGSESETYFSVIRGVGEVDLLDGRRRGPEPISTPYLEKPYEDCPYLLLDVRDPDEYKACHITGGKQLLAKVFVYCVRNGFENHT